MFQLHLDAEEGRVRGDLEPLTLRTCHDSRPFLSIDGTRAVYVSDRTGNSDIWSKDLNTGKETNLTFSPDSENYGIISADGKKIAFMKANTKRSIYSVVFAGGSTERVCEVCGTPAHWSPDGKYILYEIEAQRTRVPLSAVEVSSGRKLTVLSDSKLSLFDPRFSPDGRWISFHVSVRPGMRRIFVVPFRDGKVPDKAEWIPITGETTSSAFSLDAATRQPPSAPYSPLAVRPSADSAEALRRRRQAGAQPAGVERGYLEGGILGELQTCDRQYNKK